MSLLSGLSARCRTWFRGATQGDRLDAEMEAELQHHLENLTAELMRSGLPRDTRSSTTSNAATSRSRPASSGGRWPAPGANGLRTGSTIGQYRGF